MYRILVVGAGYVGAAVAGFFQSKRQKVWGVIRTEARREILENMGVIPVVADITDPATLARLPAAHFIVISPAPSERTETAYRSIYLEGIRNVLDRIQQNPQPSLIVYLSSTGVYGDCGGRKVDETVEPCPQTAKEKILAESERQVLSSELPSVIFRLAGIYGPGRNWVERLRKGKYPAPEEDEYLNMIHLEDVVAALPVLFNKAKKGSVYLGVDDEPVKRSEFFHWLSDEMNALGLELSDRAVLSAQASGAEGRGKQCSNRRLKELGFSFKYPTFREGYRSLLREIYAQS